MQTGGTLHWSCWFHPALLLLGKTPLQGEEATNNQIILIIIYHPKCSKIRLSLSLKKCSLWISIHLLLSQNSATEDLRPCTNPKQLL